MQWKVLMCLPKDLQDQHFRDLAKVLSELPPRSVLITHHFGRVIDGFDTALRHHRLHDNEFHAIIVPASKNIFSGCCAEINRTMPHAFVVHVLDTQPNIKARAHEISYHEGEGSTEAMFVTPDTEYAAELLRTRMISQYVTRVLQGNLNGTGNDGLGSTPRVFQTGRELVRQYQEYLLPDTMNYIRNHHAYALG